jgi:hypothetical protein
MHRKPEGKTLIGHGGAFFANLSLDRTKISAHANCAVASERPPTLTLSGTLLDRETGANITSTKLARLPEIRLNSAAKLVLQRRNRVLSPKPTNHQ